MARGHEGQALTTLSRKGNARTALIVLLTVTTWAGVAAGQGRPCRQLSGTHADSSLRAELMQVPLPLPNWVNVGPTEQQRNVSDRGLFSVTQLILPADSLPELRIVVANPGRVSDIDLVAIVVDGCLWPGVWRSTGWAPRMSDAARDQWNEAARTFAREIRDSGAAEAISVLYLSYATGRVVMHAVRGLRVDSSTSDAWPPQTAVQSVTVQRTGSFWLATGIWQLNAELGRRFSIVLRPTGAVESATLAEYQRLPP